MQDIAITVFGVSGLLALVSLLPPLATRLNLPYTVLLAAAGCGLGAIVAAAGETGGGPVGDFVAALGGFGVSSEALLYIFLPTLLFEAALVIDARRLLDDVAPILLLAVVAVIVCMLVVGFALSIVSGVGPIACLLLGAIVATTDPAAVVGVFRDLGAPQRLNILIEGESLFNDAAAIALFTLLLAMLLGERTADPVAAAFTFVKGFAGGVAVGYLAARAACALFAPLRGMPRAEITLTVSLAYLAFIVAERYVHASGVVAVVTAALVMGAVGRMRITQTSWRTLIETWQQLGFWANSLVFLLAAMLVPRLLAAAGVREALLLAVLVAATLAARALVVYGLLPILSAAGLAEKVSGPYKLVTLWGGLRGAVSLALALAVSENRELPVEVRQFVAVLTTGFVLFTLFVNGLTLRPLLRLLQLDKLSPVDRAVRDRALALALTTIKERVGTVAAGERIDAPIAAEVARGFAARIADAERAVADATDGAGLSDDERVQVGLHALAAHERELYLARLAERVISRKIADVLAAQGGRLVDGVKTGGRAGYAAAAERALAFPATFRAAVFAHHRFGVARWLAARLADRFETLLIAQMTLRQLAAFNGENIGPLLGAIAGNRLGEILDARRAATERALDALKLQYPDYARALQAKYLGRVALRLEETAYRAMLADSVISQEIFNDLARRLAVRWQEMDRRPPLDIQLRREEIVARVPVFAGLEPTRLAEIARLLRPRLALPGERIIARGERGDAMYFIASGAVEVRVQPAPVRLGSGDFFGEIALVTDRRRTADVVALGYCRLLVLQLRDLRRLLAADPVLRRRIDEVARERLATGQSGED